MSQSESAESVFESWSRAGGLRGSAELDELCTRYPAHSNRLRELFAEWSKSRANADPGPANPAAARQRVVRALFEIARTLPPSEREAQVRHAAGADTSLAEEVLSLLAHASPEPDPRGFTVQSVGDGTLSDRLRRHFGEGVDPKIALGNKGYPETESQVLNELRDRGDRSGRYRVTGEVGHGGMGAVYSVLDRDLRRTLAMKVMREKNNARLSRFLEEAQITGQLDHPNIVPVHELGLDEDGHVFFTMKLVRGETLSRVFDKVNHEVDGWNIARALSVILRVCDAMAFAHEKGVIHRDLKPSNVMVGRFGEVYVMDWGLAQVLGHVETKDIRIRKSDDPISSGIDTLRHRRPKPGEANPGTESPSPVITMDGDVVGTPCYMPPEQAEARVADIGPRSDVYSIGAMIYRLLAGTDPYVDPEEHADGAAILGRVISGPPRPLRDVTIDAPAEVVAICEKAMSRNIDDRYPSVLALAEDIRAYLEGRVVRAHGGGLVAELRKWVARNRIRALLGCALLVLFFLVPGYLAKRHVELKNANEELRASRRRAKELNDAIEDLLATDDIEAARRIESSLFPAWPATIPKMQSWLDHEAKRVIDLAGRLDATLRELGDAQAKAIAKPRAPSAEGVDKVETTQRALEKLAALKSDATRIATITKPRVEERIAWAKQLAALTIDDPTVASKWREAHDAIASADGERASTLYRDIPIDLKPQIGLVPIGRNPVTKLWEFYDLASAWDHESKEDPRGLAIPAHQPDGTIAMNANSGLIFVLVPGGPASVGSQKTDPSAPHYDPLAEPDEAPRSEDGAVILEPYFLSKYEVTRQQWHRLALAGSSSRDSSARRPDLERGDHPVDQVSWEDCTDLLPRFGLSLPTEAEWEYACRARGAGAWPFPDAPVSAALYGNTLPLGNGTDDAPATLRVGSLRPNPFGFYDMFGNAAEWCDDAYGPYTTPARSGDGRRQQSDETQRVLRGGSYLDPVARGRCADREHDSPASRSRGLGVRPTRALRRE